MFCLSEEKINLTDIDAIVFYEKPFLKFERLLETYIGFAPACFKSFCDIANNAPPTAERTPNQKMTSENW